MFYEPHYGMAEHNASNEETASATSSPPAVSATIVRLPPFWAQYPEVWFAEAEGLFWLRANLPPHQLLYRRAFLTFLRFRRNSPSQSANSPNEIIAPRQDINRLRELVVSMLPQTHPNFDHSSCSGPTPVTPAAAIDPHSRNISLSPKHGTRFCWYHQRFGAAAERCGRPCAW